MPLNNFYKKIVKLQEFNVIQETTDIINQNAEFIKELLREQLRLGKDGNNENVTIFGRDFYADSTIFRKEKYGVGTGKITEWVTNYMSGRFYNSLQVRVQGEEFSIYSDIEYFPEILARSGSVIMELNKSSLLRFREEILLPQLEIRFNSRVNV